MDLEHGVLMTTIPSDFIERRARRVALNVQRILLGDDPEDLPIAFTQPLRLTINMRTVRSIGVYPSWDVLSEAELLFAEQKEVQQRYSFFDVIPIITSYGCPYNCAFCLQKFLHPYYFSLPTKKVVRMIEDALNYGAKIINIIDDNFLFPITVGKSWSSTVKITFNYTDKSRSNDEEWEYDYS